MPCPPTAPSSNELLTWLRHHADEQGRVTGARHFYYERGYTFAQMQSPRRAALADLEERGLIRRVGPRNSAVYEVID